MPLAGCREGSLRVSRGVLGNRTDEVRATFHRTPDTESRLPSRKTRTMTSGHRWHVEKHDWTTGHESDIGMRATAPITCRAAGSRIGMAQGSAIDGPRPTDIGANASSPISDRKRKKDQGPDHGPYGP